MFMDVRKDLIQAARGDKIVFVSIFDLFKCFEEIKDREKIKRLGGESSTWSVFEGRLKK